MAFKSIIGTMCACLTVVSFNANAATVTSYDVFNTNLSGWGEWTHTYDGTISGNDYTGGSGTMNDGVIGTSIFNTHLLVSSDNSSITVYLNESTNLTSLFLYSFESSNNEVKNDIPGNITGLNVTINGVTEYFTTGYFGTGYNHLGAHESINFEGSSLEGLATDMLMLSGFTTEAPSSAFFSISEIEVNGVSAVPVPATIWLFGSGLLGLVGLARRKKA